MGWLGDTQARLLNVPCSPIYYSISMHTCDSPFTMALIDFSELYLISLELATFVLIILVFGIDDLYFLWMLIDCYETDCLIFRTLAYCTVHCSSQDTLYHTRRLWQRAEVWNLEAISWHFITVTSPAHKSQLLYEQICDAATRSTKVLWFDLSSKMACEFLYLERSHMLFTMLSSG